MVIANIFFSWAVACVNKRDVTSEQATKLFHSPDVRKLSFDEAERLRNEDATLYAAYAANHNYYRPRGAELDIYPPASQPGGLTLLSGRGRIVSQKLNIERREFVYAMVRQRRFGRAIAGPTATSK